ncbi:MAG: 30S ribosomal protein S17 [Planctomycetes bacterium]|nr:30S ribosomal protein S17 [Planctomycetota bacterium]
MNTNTENNVPAPVSSPAPQPSASARNQRKVVRGTVVSDKMQKTIVVQVERKVRHPLYEKFVSRRTKLRAHDEKGEAHVGDVVEVVQTRPLSKTKCWRLVRILQRASHH